jgi:HlyD family secretion protein
VKIEESQSLLQMSLAVQSIVGYLPSYVKRNLDRTIVTSPVTGTILKRHVWNEKVMTPGEPLLDIGNLDELEVTAEILTVSAVRIQPGDRVEIFGEPFGDQTLSGTVRLVKPEAFTKMSSLGVEEQRVDVKISFSDQELQKLELAGKTLGLNYRVRVRIITDEKSNALKIPRTALFHGIEGQWQVYKIIDDSARLTDIDVGLMNEFEVQITAGLTPGDSVILAPESSISDGSKVIAAD